MRLPFASVFASLLMLAIMLPICTGQAVKKEKEPVSSETLEIAGKTLQEWIAEIPSSDRSKGENAIRTVLAFGAERAYEALPVISKVMASHNNPNPLDVSMRVNGALALGQIIGNANQPDKKHVQDAVLVLTRLMSDSESIVRYRAAEALGKIGPEARPAIAKLLENIDDVKTWEVRQAVCTALGFIAADEKNKTAPPVEVQRALFQRLFDSASRVRLAAIQSLTYLGTPANPVHKDNLIKELGKVAIQDSDPSIRIWAHMAIMGCSEISDPRVNEIAKMVKHRDVMARLQAAQAIGTIGTKAKVAVPMLIVGLDDSEDTMVMYSIWALSRMEIWGKPAVPMLQKLADDKERAEIVRRAATDAITAIEGKTLSAPVKKG